MERARIEAAKQGLAGTSEVANYHHGRSTAFSESIYWIEKALEG